MIRARDFSASPVCAKPILIRQARGYVTMGVAIFSPGWGSCVWPESHLTYTIDIALTTEFALAVGGSR